MRVVLPSNHLTAQIPSANLKKLGPAENLDSGTLSTLRALKQSCPIPDGTSVSL